MTHSVLTVDIRSEHDIVAARRRARQIAALLGFDLQDQTRIATSVSEIARNTFQYASGGRAEFLVENDNGRTAMRVRLSDRGPGIPDLQCVLAGRYRSRTGMGLGIIGARRLMDDFQIDSAPGQGTMVCLTKFAPGRAALTPQKLARISQDLANQPAQDLLEELQRQNQELLRTLKELRDGQEELRRVNTELEDTNRGIMALYAELDEKAEGLREAVGMKSRFLCHMSHEFRTPLNSILALTGLMLERSDGPLTLEQEKQLSYIRRSGENLLDLVNDLLELARVEAGRIVVRPAEFQVSSLFGALRGMFKPLLKETVNLVFEEPVGIPSLFTDEGKLTQILRNFISNALKFTDRGEVRISAEVQEDGTAVRFSVSDTGIGIAPELQEAIFQEFIQVENALRARSTGSGLGLPIARKLAELLGGSVAVRSLLGTGSIFSVTIRAVAPTIRKEAPLEYSEMRINP